MTSQLLILGNGFDLHCGLKSSYKDFFRQALLDTTTENFNVIQLKPGVAGFWENLLLEYCKRHRALDYKWCDIETIIKNTLWRVYYGKENRVSNINNGIGKQALDRAQINSIEKYNFDDITDYIDKYVFVYCFRFFDALGLEYRHLSDQEKISLLINSLLRELHSFERRFCKYLRDNIVNSENRNELNEVYFNNAVALLAKLIGVETDDFLHTDKENVLQKLQSTYVLSFNYTTFLDYIYDDSPCHYSNVHGKLCRNVCTKDCKVSSIIFGIDDTLIQTQSGCDDLKLFSKTYRKMTDLSNTTDILPSNNIPVDIKFYGHSLSEADYSYFQSIFDYYNLYGNRDVTLTFFYSDSYNSIDAVYRLINSYGKSLTNRDQGKNLIHKLLLENRLKIQKID